MPDDPPVLDALLAATHLVVPDDLPALVRTHAERLGARLAVVYLADLDQRLLVPLTPADAPVFEAVKIDGTLAGRCYRTLTIVEGHGDNGDATMWVPVVDGTERLGVLQLMSADGLPSADDAEAFSSLIAALVMTKANYGDYFEIARRTEPLTIGSELLWQLLPPLTFGTEDLVITAAFIPTARLGGDAFDYGVDKRAAQVAIFDALGHDLGAGLLATTAVAAFRHARRSRLDLESTAKHIGAAVAGQFDPSKFVTGVVCSLDVASGLLSWCAGGHPTPLLLRHGRVVKDLNSAHGQPFGVGPASEVMTEQLEPGDRILLYTDGVTEARNGSGDFFELQTLIDLVSRTSDSDAPPETMRLLMHAIEAHNDGPLRDDATVVLIEWRGPGSRELVVSSQP